MKQAATEALSPGLDEKTKVDCSKASLSRRDQGRSREVVLLTVCHGCASCGCFSIAMCIVVHECD